MERVIEGKVYDTRTAKRICELPCSAEFRSDFYWHDTDLYKSPAGTFFIAGEGSPLSMWGEAHGQGGRIGGSGLRLITQQEARGIAEAAGLDPKAYEDAFGAVEIG